MTERVWHYVKPNETLRLPRRHIFLDTESQRGRTKTGGRQVWRLGVATYRIAEKGRPAKESTSVYHAARKLWVDVDTFTKGRHRTVLWAHNLGFDVRISDAFRILPVLGWRLVAHNLANRGTWLQWRKGDASLLMVDSASVFPTTLAQLAKSFVTDKHQIPADSDGADVWEAYCRRDVQILRDAVVAYLDWIESAGLGSWQLTGAGQSYAAFRHRFMTHPLLVHGDADALAAERRAMWTGRCEAYWKGKTRGGHIEEWDLSLAYARIVRDTQLPTRLVGEVEAGRELSQMLALPSSAILAQVAMEIDVPVVPTLVGGYVAWPVGNFSTTLWGPELALALEVGATVTVERAFLYRTAPALRQWAQWLIHEVSSPDSGATEWQRLILKHWSRALIGRFGMQYSRWEPFGVTRDLGVRQSLCYDRDRDQLYELAHIGADVQRCEGTVEWDQSQPAITGYVMSCARVWLWRLLQAMPPESVLYADTDSFYIRSEHHDQAAALAATPLGEGLRLKSSHKRLTILGPRQIVTDGVARIAGLPHRAQLLPDGRFAGEVWSSLRTSISRGDPSAVITTDRTWKVSGIDRRRTGGPTGWTQPIAVEGGE